LVLESPTLRAGLLAIVWLFFSVALNVEAESSLTLVVIDSTSHQPVPCRIHLVGPNGQAVKPPELPFWRDHFVCTGAVQLALPPGAYRWQVERGPEWSRTNGAVTLSEETGLSLTNELHRLVDLKSEGWWGGETHVHRPLPMVELLMQAEDLPVAEVITWWNRVNPWTNQARLPAPLPVTTAGNRIHNPLGGEDERDGGALLFLGGSPPFDITEGTRHFPSSLAFANKADKRPERWIDAEKPFWWDFPMWVAHDVIDTVGIAHNHMHRGGVYENEAWGRPRNLAKYPGPQGNGRYTQDIYYHLLNTGVRLPPSAGSASGVLPNPVGYNRVFVHVDGEFSYARWKEGLKAGRSFVSNGPLLRARANGFWPGAVFRTNGALEIRLEAQLDSSDGIAAVELVHNGQVESVKLPANLTIRESGWFLLRVIADVPNTFRFASTAPWYVELNGKPMQPKAESAGYFVDWCRERIGNLKSLSSISDAQKREIVQPWLEAEKFWIDRFAPPR
jgi:hypothetical protein